MKEKAKAHNDKYYMSEEEANKLKSKSEQCSVIVIGQQEVANNCIASVDIAAMTIRNAAKIKDGIRPEEQENPIDAKYAAEFGKNGLVIVTDSENRKSTVAEKRPENKAQRASREKVELSNRAEKKYEANNSVTEVSNSGEGSTQTAPTDVER